MNLLSYHAKYFAHELTKRSASDSIEKLASALVDAQVDLNPHQVEAALFAFKSPLSKGAILADEVGLGKTIEAGLVISQKWAEKKRKILIITPANLRKQWSQELQDKFFLPAYILEAKSFNNRINGKILNPFEHTEIILCSYQFAKAKQAYLKLIDWDLVVIDEAHRLRNVYKSGLSIAKTIKQALDHSPKILLTATPLQNSLLELYGLVSIIDEHTFGDLKSFKTKYSRVSGNSDAATFNELKERLRPICKRTLRRQVLEYIKYTNRIPLVEEFYPSQEEQELYDLVTTYLQRDTLFALPPSQRKLMTLILRKLLASSTFAISGTLEGLSRKLQDMAQANGITDPFTTVESEYETTDELKEEWDEDQLDGPEPIDLTPDQLKGIQQERDDLNRFAELATNITVNSKGEKLLTALQKGFEELKRLGANNKAIIFTESTRTQAYLLRILETDGYGYKGKIVLFNGTNTDVKSREVYKAWCLRHGGTDKITGSKSADMRAALVDYFRDEAIIMIATEAAAEGINLQFCSLVINYDMPWNPQRIEQRIGRCHRYGQKFDVVVLNFLNKNNAADVRVYELLQEKFNLFSGVFGASDEVLGSIESGLDFEKRIARIYQICRTTDEIQKEFDTLQADLEESISQTIKQTRLNLLENFDEEVNDKLRINLQESREYRNKYEDWLWQITKYYLGQDADFTDDDHSFSLNTNPFNDLDINQGPYRIGKQKDQPEATIVTNEANPYRISHPLAQRIIKECKEADLAIRLITFDYTNTPSKISVIEPFIGQSGWLKANLLTVTTFDTEEFVLLTATDAFGNTIPPDDAKRFFSLNATEGETQIPNYETRQTLDEAYATLKQHELSNLELRNGKWFDEEMNKLDAWADDLKVGLEREITDLDAEIKLKKAEAKKIAKLDEKLKLQRLIKGLEQDRAEKRKRLYEAHDEVDLKKDTLITSIESKLKQSTRTTNLFTIRWAII